MRPIRRFQKPVEQEAAPRGRFVRAGVVMLSRLLALALLLLPAPRPGRRQGDGSQRLRPRGSSSWWTPKAMSSSPKTPTSHSSRPPSTKLVTSWLALEVLGADYRFETRFYLDAKRVLYVKGGGDPYLISEEELALLAPALVAKIGKAPITRHRG